MKRIGREFLLQSGREAKRLKKSADHAIDQLSVANLYTSLDEYGNCVAVLMKHIAGFIVRYCGQDLKGAGRNSSHRSRLDFTIEEGETVKVVRAQWEQAWESFFHTLETLPEDRLLKSVEIEGKTVTLLSSLQFNQAHLAFHVGQIVFLAKHLRGCDWEPLGEDRQADGPVLVERGCC